MNKTRRQKIQEIINRLQQCYDDLESVKEDEDDARDNTPENLQGSDSYSESEGYSDAMDDALSSLSDAIGGLEVI